MMTMDPVDKKLDMSLDEIAENRKTTNNNNGGGKTKNTKRAERSAQRTPYPSRAIASRRGNGRQANDDIEDVSAGRRVYVGNLSWSVNAEVLRNHMRSAGKIEDVSIMQSNGRSKGCALVQYSTEGEARYAIRSLHDTEIDGRKIFVREDREAPKSTAASASANPRQTTTGCRVYVGNLSWTVKWQDLKDHMKQVGNVVYCDVLEESAGRSKGCGLVEYETPQEAQQAISQLNDTEIDGRMIFVREDREPDGGSILSIAKRSLTGQGRGNTSGPRVQQPQQRINNGNVEGTALYIGNLPWDVTWQNLKDVFKSVGLVERAEIAQMPDGKSRGFGIVRFVHARDAQAAIAHFNGAEINGREMEVRYDKGR